MLSWKKNVNKKKEKEDEEGNYKEKNYNEILSTKRKIKPHNCIGNEPS